MSSKTMTMGFLSLPAELICHILLFLTPRDLCRRAIATCKTFRDAAQNSVQIQHKLELFAQGFTETITPGQDSIDFFKKDSCLKKSALMSRSDFHVNTVFQEAVPAVPAATKETQSLKCGLWWMSRDNDLIIQECKPNTTQTWSNHILSPMPQHKLVTVIVDPLQDLLVTIFSFNSIDVLDVLQAHHVFWLEIRMLSSQAPHPDSACTSLDCSHLFNERGINVVMFMKEPAICGDRIVVPYCTFAHGGWAELMFIQVVDWRRGQAYPVGGYEARNPHQNILHLIDRQTFVVIDLQASISLHTLQESGEPPQCRIVYWFPISDSLRHPPCVVHTTPLVQGTAVRPDLMPSYVPFLESQIMVLEMLLPVLPVVLVIDMAIFSENALRSEDLVTIDWLDWGPQHTCCFPHDPSHRISVFGSRMAYALPRYRTPTPGHRLEALSTDGRFYVHIWDFNQRVVARSKSISDCNSLDHLIRKPPFLAHTFYKSDFSSNRSYTTTVCHTSFPTRDFEGLFLEQDRFTLTWVRPDGVDIQVVSPHAVPETKALSCWLRDYIMNFWASMTVGIISHS
ncbi:uncharacterized protein HD556DRAFT_227113 [Suillus plorans]|uniref:F-box domain-containing protein n=1 Tax=Suillus plorans TaxID=116603 RepID=A0A9P7DM68_9AGAM|nr:uncharacterized protein HD556DRAFT_227113 [Suillus plorans]KAG1798215.1 hypothetical protein HD556DRAFT_227113 [Suillus plorans]